jgi:hypothetical protein
MSLGIQARTALRDEELASRYLAAGNTEYFAQIFVRHRRLVFCACRRFFGSNSLVEDATQGTFLRGRYKLRADSASGASQLLVSGRAVQFESGKVIEMWMESMAIFETNVASGANPQN